MKPGPYILAEYKWQGLPEWLIDSTGKNAHALDENGNIISPFMMSYMSDEYLNHSLKWYDKIIPVIAERQISNNGPIVMMQVCNEIGVLQRLSGKVDFHPSVIRMYKEFLIEKYKSIETLNQIYKAMNEEVIAKTKNNKVCGIRMKTGNGMITILGFAFRYTSEEHLRLIEKIVKLDKIKKQAKVSDPDIGVVISKNNFDFLGSASIRKKKAD